MHENTDRRGTAADPAAAREALREELRRRGHGVASDTLGAQRDLYILGANDLARALFHFDDDADVAAMAMYRASGSWVQGMPVRFAVLPAEQSSSPSLEMLEQMRAVPLFHELVDGRVVFAELDRALEEHLAE